LWVEVVRKPNFDAAFAVGCPVDVGKVFHPFSELGFVRWCEDLRFLEIR
jgi:desulfoferrodoxin (superoxide reductase-like protein)